jgi:hypothetical protein
LFTLTSRNRRRGNVLELSDAFGQRGKIDRRVHSVLHRLSQHPAYPAHRSFSSSGPSASKTNTPQPKNGQKYQTSTTSARLTNSLAVLLRVIHIAAHMIKCPPSVPCEGRTSAVFGTNRLGHHWVLISPCLIMQIVVQGQGLARVAMRTQLCSVWMRWKGRSRSCQIGDGWRGGERRCLAGSVNFKLGSAARCTIPLVINILRKQAKVYPDKVGSEIGLVGPASQ